MTSSAARGGIREVEFFAQIHQLIHGGRIPAARAPATLDALAGLAAQGLIPADDAAALADAYRTLRTIEHRLQMIDDHQTHRLPTAPADMDNVAHLAGLADGPALVDLLAPHVAVTGGLYDALEQEEGEGLPQAHDSLEDRLTEAGFADAAAARSRIEGWREGRTRTTRSQAARDALEAVLPRLVEALACAPAPDCALDRFDNLVARLPSAVNLFRLLEARPALIGQLADILSHAPDLGRCPLARRHIARWADRRQCARTAAGGAGPRRRFRARREGR
jgi:glutamate-ammonia-ligase adenylyltransferase